MTEEERSLDLIIGDLEQENRLLRARNDRLQKIADAAKDMCAALKEMSTFDLWNRKLNALEKLLSKHDS